MTYENDARDLSEDGKELGDERATADEDGDEDDEEAFRKIIDAVENHDGDISLLHSGTGMYLLGHDVRVGGASCLPHQKSRSQLQKNSRHHNTFPRVSARWPVSPGRL